MQDSANISGKFNRMDVNSLAAWRALNRRLIAAYDAVDILTTDDASDASQDATSFVTFCERLIDSA